MCHMRKKATVRDLHLKTSEIVRRVASGETFVIEKHGTAVAELRPLSRQSPTTPLPDRGAFLRRTPRVKVDSGRVLEQDRT